MLSLRSKILLVIFLILLLLLQYRLWFDKDGFFAMMRLKKQLAVEVQTNAKLKARNEALLSQVKHIQKNQEAVESRARDELGMIKSDEKFYQVVHP